MDRDTARHVIVWEFQVREGCEAEFERFYGPRGAWAQLFAAGKGYLGTELLRDAGTPGRYLTIDRWADAGAFAAFREANAAAYDALNTQCESWTARERPLGAWTVIQQ